MSLQKQKFLRDVPCFVILFGSYLSGRRQSLSEDASPNHPRSRQPPALCPTQRSQASTNLVSRNLHLNRACNVPCLLPLAVSYPIILPHSASTKKGDGSKFHRVDGTAVMTASARKRALCDSVPLTNNNTPSHIKIIILTYSFAWVWSSEAYLRIK